MKRGDIPVVLGALVIAGSLATIDWRIGAVLIGLLLIALGRAL